MTTTPTSPTSPPGSQQKYDRTSYILIVDDDDTLLKFFKIHLNKFFSKVIVVRNAKEAIDTLRDKEIDLVISDIKMPKMDGLQLMKRIHKHDMAIPVLLISGALIDAEDESLKEADGYLRKPFTVDDLHDFIRHGMEKREKMKLLASMVSDKKHLRGLLAGKVKVEKVVKKEDQRKAHEIINQLLEVA